MRAAPSVRVTRAAVFAALCVLLATGGHALGTGMVPPVWVQAAGFGPVFAAGCLLAGRERSLPAIGTGTLTAQGGLHLAFVLARPYAGTTARDMPGMGGTQAVDGMGMAHAHALAPHATVAHVGAAVLLTWWLRRGEAAVWSLLRRAARLVPGLAAWWQVCGGVRGVPDAQDAVRPGSGGPPRLRRLLLRHAVQRRGPPAGTSYASRPRHPSPVRRPTQSCPSHPPPCAAPAP
ncbi:hypothetical protein ACIRPX_24015 [Streptomyces sp. NPDC101225]|uniref:hypothetical protein n=1 Tax=Streptomyces sp. NPDC101225 TaxID=3366135 RepID=UPI00381A64EE